MRSSTRSSRPVREVEPGAQARTAGAVDAPPTRHGFKGGDLLGIAERLDYLADLGVNALYLNPVLTSASNHRYHTDDYEHVDPLLGGDPALRELIDTCHARGFRVILDGVFNHSGRGWFPFHHIVENGSGSPYVDWFYLDAGRLAEGRQVDPYPDEELLAEMRHVAAADGLPTGIVPNNSSATAAGGTCRRYPRSRSSTVRPVPTCWTSRSAGSDPVLTAGASMSPRRSTSRSGASSGACQRRRSPGVPRR